MSISEKERYNVATQIGVSVFEDSHSGRIKIKDPLNAYMFKTMFRDYIHWHEDKGKFYDGYDSDKRHLAFLSYSKWVWALAGF